jgi:CHASE3 domain sensor protein
LEHLAILRLRVENVENGHRDFVVSGTEASLERSRANASVADTEQATLLALTADNPHQQRRLGITADLQRMVQQRSTSRVSNRTTCRLPAASGRDSCLTDVFLELTAELSIY